MVGQLTANSLASEENTSASQSHKILEFLSISFVLCSLFSWGILFMGLTFKWGKKLQAYCLIGWLLTGQLVKYRADFRRSKNCVSEKTIKIKRIQTLHAVITENVQKDNKAVEISFDLIPLHT